MDGYIDLPKPRKPQAVDRKSIGFGKGDKAGFIQQITNLLEFKKFIPDYEQYLYAGKDDDAYNKSLEQFGKLSQNKDGSFSPSFGSVSRSLQNGAPRAMDQIKKVVGLQIENDDTMGDFEHIEGVTAKTSVPVNPLISEDLWADAQKYLKTQKESYYELMMKNNLEKKDPEEAFYIMIGMLESRTRVWDTMADVFGKPGQSEEERQETFNAWLKKWQGQLDDGQIGFMQFFLDTQQSFISHIMPMYGGSNEDTKSSKDQEAAQAFFDTLSEKVREYTGISDLTTVTDEQLAELPEDKATAIRLWNAWLNPEYITSVTQNVDPLTEAWSKQPAKAINEDIDTLANSNLAANTISSRRKDEYKQKLEEYQEKVEDKQRDEMEQQKVEAKRNAEKKQLEQKLIAVAQQKSREARGLPVAASSPSRKGSSPASSGSSKNTKQAVAAITKRIDALRGKPAPTTKSATPSTARSTSGTQRSSSASGFKKSPSIAANKPSSSKSSVSVAAAPKGKPAPRKAAPKAAAAPKFKSKLTIG
jgi:hypothetical protein